MRTLTFKVTVDVDTLPRVDVEYLQQQVARSILSSHEMLDLGPVDEMGAEAVLLTVQDS